ncbi:NADH dehydrogenase [Formivibrio citricus]|uniref:NADH:ubiquinone reductase (non-electrogenic) n=1 Tax=Formivibrio citricus TaxID=83765 RepID=A0A1I4YKJ4_9NEIS|nr:NAD(P)/FAD-dependent oxidoreductase [Formivibrio citricus]SFN38572.1 NADH dehydrogenase [Formivibrio citricus]
MKKPKIVIVGAGFGGLAVVRALHKAAVDIVVIDRRNHHLFQPLLYQVAAAILSPAEIATPVRSLLAGLHNVSVMLGEVNEVDTEARHVQVNIGSRTEQVDYDYLVLATGARHAYFGNDHWEALAPGLKTIDDATAIRNRILLAFERAEMSNDPEEIQRLLTIAIVGGGPTGVEMAGTIAELAHAALSKEFRRIHPEQTRVMLVEGSPRVLASFPEDLSKAAAESLRKLGVEVLEGARVTDCNEAGIVIGNKQVAAGTVIWAAGVKASPAAAWLGVEADQAGRVKVKPDFSIPGRENVFVIGDTAAQTDATGKAVPGVAQGAIQGGEHVGKQILARLAGKPAPAPFRYFNWGNMATIGRHSAVADFGWMKMKGALAWWLWGVVHIMFLIGFRNRIAVMLHWLWSFLTFKRGVRLITGTKT